MKSSREVCHKWASQSQNKGESGHIFFEDKTIYSYGRHFPMACFIKPDVVLFTSKDYSITTSQHKSDARSAIGGHIKVFTVPNVHCNNKNDHIENVKYYVEQLNTTIKQYFRARNRAAWIWKQNNVLFKELSEYCTAFDVKMPENPEQLCIKPENEAALREKIQTETTKQRKEQAELRKQAKKQIEKTLTDWLNGQTNETYVSYKNKRFDFTETMLRYLPESKEVQTSLGARVPVIEAKALYRLIKKGENVHGQTIGGYAVLGWNGSLKVGCHNISRKEIERFAGVMNW